MVADAHESIFIYVVLDLGCLGFVDVPTACDLVAYSVDMFPESFPNVVDAKPKHVMHPVR